MKVADPTRAHGHDWAHYQGDKLFAQENPGDDFAALKATQGTDWIDPEFDDADDRRWTTLGEDVAAGRKAGRVAYGFLNLAPGGPQVDHLLAVTGKPCAGTRHALDWEGQAQKDPHVLVQAVGRYVETCPGYSVLVYCAESKVPVAVAALWAAGLRLHVHYDLWIADWNGEPNEEWTFWQDSDGQGLLDHDVFNGDFGACQGWFGTEPPPPPQGGFLMALTDPQQVQVLQAAIMEKWFIRGFVIGLGLNPDEKGANERAGEEFGKFVKSWAPPG